MSPLSLRTLKLHGDDWKASASTFWWKFLLSKHGPLTSISKLGHPELTTLTVSGMMKDANISIPLLPSTLTKLEFSMAPNQQGDAWKMLMSLPTSLESLSCGNAIFNFDWISRLSNLDSLTLRNHIAWDDEPRFDDFRNISSLKRLAIVESYIMQRQMAARDWKTVNLRFPNLIHLESDVTLKSSMLSNFPNLTSLDAFDCELQPLPEHLTNLKFMQVGPGASWVFRFPPQLRKLDWQYNQFFSESDIQDIPKSLPSLPSHLTSFAFPISIQNYESVAQELPDLLPRQLLSLKLMIRESTESDCYLWRYWFPARSKSSTFDLLLNPIGHPAQSSPTVAHGTSSCDDQILDPSSALEADSSHQIIFLPSRHPSLTYFCVTNVLGTYPFMRFSSGLLEPHGYRPYIGLDGEPNGWIDIMATAQSGRLDLLQKLICSDPSFVDSISPFKHNFLHVCEFILRYAPLSMITWLLDRDFLIGEPIKGLSRIVRLWRAAIAAGRLDVLKVLAKRRPRDPVWAATGGICLAILFGHKDIAEFLIMEILPHTGMIRVDAEIYADLHCATALLVCRDGSKFSQIRAETLYLAALLSRRYNDVFECAIKIQKAGGDHLGGPATDQLTAEDEILELINACFLADSDIYLRRYLQWFENHPNDCQLPWDSIFASTIQFVSFCQTPATLYNILTILCQLGLKPAHLYPEPGRILTQLEEEDLYCPTYFLLDDTQLPIPIPRSTYWKLAFELAKWMVEQDCPFSVLGEYDEPVSHILLKVHYLENASLIEYLVEHGKLDLESKNASGRTFMDLARSLGVENLIS
jgi:hypothetical protein